MKLAAPAQVAIPVPHHAIFIISVTESLNESSFNKSFENYKISASTPFLEASILRSLSFWSLISYVSIYPHTLDSNSDRHSRNSMIIYLINGCIVSLILCLEFLT